MDLIPVAESSLSILMDHEPTVSLEVGSVEEKGALRFIYREGAEPQSRYGHAQAAETEILLRTLGTGSCESPLSCVVSKRSRILPELQFLFCMKMTVIHMDKDSI